MRSTPVVHLLAGPNGAGKSTFVENILRPTTRLPFINADLIARDRWPNAQSERAYDAARIAAKRRNDAIAGRESFISETVFSHPSKVDLLRLAGAAGYLRYLHVILVPEDLAVQRVVSRVSHGGHTVPEDKIRSRFQRLWPLVRKAIGLVEDAAIYDNSRASNAFRLVARYRDGRPLGSPDWPAWTPEPLRQNRDLG